MCGVSTLAILSDDYATSAEFIASITFDSFAPKSLGTRSNPLRWSDGA